MPRPIAKNSSQPDQVRRFPRGTVNILAIGDTTVGPGTLEPSWRWSVDMARGLMRHR